MAARQTPELRLHAHATAWVDAAVLDITAALDKDLAAHGRARLLVSGGGTPAPVYRALSAARLAWDEIIVGQVDERWLAADDPDSNETLIRRELLVDRAASAEFQPLLGTDASLGQNVLLAQRRFAPATVAVLGMGPDGHVASLFPHMRGLDQAVSEAAAYIAVNARDCPAAGVWTERISITPGGLAAVSERVLLIRGQAKRELLERALDGDDWRELPVRLLFALPGAALRIHWYP